MKAIELKKIAKEQYCYLTTIGRVTSKDHEIEIWFGMQAKTLYLLSGSKHQSDWVKNIKADRQVQVRIGEHTFTGQARFTADEKEDANARRLLATKYYRWREGQALNSWARTALPVAIDLPIE